MKIDTMKNSILLFFLLSFQILKAIDHPLWLRSPAISPDGTAIAFCYQGNIYKVAVDGGDAIPLTISKEHCFKPVWSPDGSKIAFASKKYGNYDIFIMNADGSNPRRLTYFSKNEIPFSFSKSGKSIIYKTQFLFDKECTVYPLFYNQVYEIVIETSQISQFLSIPADNISLNPDNTIAVFQDVKGHYSYFRKHDKSPAARDIWMFNKKRKDFTRLTNFEGEDRNPHIGNNGDTVFYLSEKFNSNFNVCKFAISNPDEVKQITHYENHPVRSLSISRNNDLCYSYNGEIYLKKQADHPAKVQISIAVSPLDRKLGYRIFNSGVSEYDLSPDGKEVAFVIRGDVYVTSFFYETTRKITKSSGIERDISYSPDGTALIYSSLRNGIWSIYETKTIDNSNNGFLYGRLTEERLIIDSQKTEISPIYSPDGKYIVYYEDWHTLMLYDVEQKTKKVILPNHKSFVYSDNTKNVEWSPNSKWIMFEYSPQFMFKNDIGLVKIDDSDNIINLTQSGYNDFNPKWGSRSKMFIWLSNRDGYRDHANYRSNRDVYASFFTQKALEVFNFGEEDFLLYQADSSRLWMNHLYEPEDASERQVRLTTNSCEISDAVLSKDDQSLYYFCKQDNGYGLWVRDLRTHSSKKVQQINGLPLNLKISENGEYLLFLSYGNIYYANTSDYEIKGIRFEAESTIDYALERELVFDEFYRLMSDKFYTQDLHNTDWDFYRKEYGKFLPHINNNIDFAEMLSEMMGELNVSHSGVRYVGLQSGRDKTSSLGFFPDYNYKGKGVRIAEILEDGPLARFDSKAISGSLIKIIDGCNVNNLNHFFHLMNHRAGDFVHITFYNSNQKQTWTETIKPIGFSEINELLYNRWVKEREKQVEELSDGRLGYVHIKSMGVSTFRRLYSDILGKHFQKEALIIDVRNSSGGWIHDELLALLDGERYANYFIGGEYSGSDPSNKWHKPTVLLMNENNRSDASGFANFYKELGIGKIVGMPNQGTFSAIVRIKAVNPLFHYYVPHAGAKIKSNKYLENFELKPDYEERNDYEMILKGRDQQLERTVEIMLNSLDGK